MGLGALFLVRTNQVRFSFTQGRVGFRPSSCFLFLSVPFFSPSHAFCRPRPAKIGLAVFVASALRLAFSALLGGCFLGFRVPAGRRLAVFFIVSAFSFLFCLFGSWCSHTFLMRRLLLRRQRGSSDHLGVPDCKVCAEWGSGFLPGLVGPGL